MVKCYPTLLVGFQGEQTLVLDKDCTLIHPLFLSFVSQLFIHSPFLNLLLSGTCLSGIQIKQ